MLRIARSPSLLSTIQRSSFRQAVQPQLQAQKFYRPQKSFSSSQSPPPSRTAAAKYTKTRAGSGNGEEAGAGGDYMVPPGPVSWVILGLPSFATAAVVYYQIERERRLENAMEKVSGESGWSPNPEYFVKRQFKKTKYGWFPVEDAFGGGECDLIDFLSFVISIVFEHPNVFFLYFSHIHLVNQQ